MTEKYPNTVCINCLVEAVNDTKKFENRKPKWSDMYSLYITKCEVCGNETECTESSDAGYPTFKYVKLRLRSRKINKILKRKNDNT